MIRKLNHKGVSLIELLITVAIIGVVSPLIFSIFISGMHYYFGGTNYLDQQYKRQDVLRLIRRDVESARIITFIGEGEPDDPVVKYRSVKFSFNNDDTDYRIWRISENDGEGSLELSTDGINFTGRESSIVGLDFEHSYFAYYIDGSIEQLILNILPKENASLLNKGRNVHDVITTEFSVRYKDVVILE
ncbi:UNVERIFIED_CONTAM: type IV pilus assembly protein PilA [Acetivibrio alkalicellulosi]